MNAGQKLVALSGLSSGTALTHLLAITQGTGDGRTIFASQMTVSIEVPSMSVVRKPTIQVDQHRTSVPKPQPHHDPKKKRIDVVTRQARVDVMTHAESMTVIQQRQLAQFVQALPNTLHVRRSRAVNTI